MQLQNTSPESKFPNEYSDVIFIIDQYLKKVIAKIQRGPDFMNHGVYAKIAFAAVAVPQAHSECSPDILTGFKGCFAGAEKGKKELKRTEGMKEGGVHTKEEERSDGKRYFTAPGMTHTTAVMIFTRWQHGFQV